MKTKIKTALNYLCAKVVFVNPLYYIRFANFLFIGQLMFLHGTSLFVHYPSPPLWDTLWYLLDKIFIFTVYAAILCFVKDTFVRWEVLAVCVFCIYRIAWQIWELVDYQSANSDPLQLGIFFMDMVALAMLIVLWISVAKFNEKIEEIT